MVFGGTAWRFQLAARFCGEDRLCLVSAADGAESDAMQFEAERPGNHVLHLQVSPRGTAHPEGLPSAWSGEVDVHVGQARIPGSGPAVIHIDGSGNDVRFDPHSGTLDLHVRGSGNAVGPSRGHPDGHSDLGFGKWEEVQLRPRSGAGVLQPQKDVDAGTSIHDRLTVRPDHAHRAPCSLLLLGDQVEVGRSLHSLDLRAFLPERFSPEEKSAALQAVSGLALRLDARQLSSAGLLVFVENRAGAVIDGNDVKCHDRRCFRSLQRPIVIALDSRGALGKISIELQPIQACVDAEGLDRSRLGHAAQSADEARRARVGGFLINLRLGGQRHSCRWIIDSVSGPDAGFGAASDGTVVLVAGHGGWIAAQRPSERDWGAWPMLPGVLKLPNGFGCRVEAGLEPDFGGI